MPYLLVLGAKSDIAHALAREYARSGYDLYLAGRRFVELERNAADLRLRFGVKVNPREFDITDYASHRDFYGHLDPRPVGVVCAAGYLGDQKWGQEEIGEVERIIGTNYLGCVSILNVVASDFERRREGFIVGISSVAGDRGRAANYLYGSAKAGFTAYLSGLRNRLYGAGVQVLTVKPGFVRTKMTAHMALPRALTTEPERAARDIFRAQRKGKDVVYTKGIWRLIMGVIVHIPEIVFKRMGL